MHRNHIFLAKVSQINDVFAPKESPNMDFLNIPYCFYQDISIKQLFSVKACNLCNAYFMNYSNKCTIYKTTCQQPVKLLVVHEGS